MRTLSSSFKSTQQLSSEEEEEEEEEEEGEEEGKEEEADESKRLRSNVDMSGRWRITNGSLQKKAKVFFRNCNYRGTSLQRTRE